MPNISHRYDTNFISQFCDHMCIISSVHTYAKVQDWVSKGY